MDTNIGVPSEILVLCTSAETKEKALSLLEQIRRNKHVGAEMTMDPALPAVCSLIASEQLGNTVVSERRAQQWSRSTPEHFKALKAEIKKILYSMNTIGTNTTTDGLLQNLAREFELDSVFLEYMIHARQAFNSAIPEKWRIQTQTVPVSIFTWICRRFKLHTKQPIDNLPNRYGIVGSDLEEIHQVLNKHWPSNADITNLLTGNERSSTNFIPSSSSNIGHSSYRDNKLNPLDPTDFSQLVNDFELDGSMTDGLHHLQKVIRQTEPLKNLVDWDSTLGKCTIFYWTCSVLKITGIKHITVRTHYNVHKKDFDKLILALDGHRGDLRRSLEEFYARNVHLTDPFKSTQVNSSDRVPESSIEDPGFHSTRKSGKRGRPRRDKSPVSSFAPVSGVEAQMAKMCDNRTYKRALLLYRSIMARSLPLSDHVPFEALPSLTVFMANEQLRNNQLTGTEIEQMSALGMNQFGTALTALYSLMKGYENIGGLIAQTKFDDMALEHGLCINTVAAMISACKYLKESKCLSESMNWESPLVTCTILFWTCAILQVPDINVNTLRRDSQATKREFDTMLQLLNNHCSDIRHRMEHDQRKGYIVSTRNINKPKNVNAHTPHSQGQFSQDRLGPGGRPSKILKSENLTIHNTILDTTQASGSFDEIIARQYLDPVATRTTEGSMNVHGSTSSKATISNVSAVAREKRHLPAEGGTDLTPFPMSNRKSGSDVSCAVISGTPLGDGGIARNTRYSTQDYADIRNKLEVWAPHEQGVSDRRDRYRLWEEKMVERYGSAWEQNITRYKDPGVAFE